MRTIGITGHTGRVGKYLLEHCTNVLALNCDVAQPDEVERSLRQFKVDCVLHLAAKSDVDWCEKNEKDATAVNLRGTFNVCHAAQILRLPVVLMSSDHIFDGVWGIYKENSKGQPLNFYGFTKLSAESLRGVFSNLKVIRTSYLFNLERLRPKLENLWNKVPDIYPTFISRTFLYLPHFIEGLLYYLDHLEKMPKVLNISGTKTTSWYDFMLRVARKFDIPNYHKLVLPKQQESGLLVPRPYHGGLHTGLSRKLGLPQYSYVQGIDQMVKDWK